MVVLALLALAATLQQQERGAPAAAPPERIDPRPLVIRGATIVDVSDFGRSAADIRDAVVVVDGGRIVAAGPRARVRVPPRARVIDARGHYLVPGYVDGFAAQANQAFANAYLAMGVTSVVASLPRPSAAAGGRPATPQDPRRAETFGRASPSPRLFFLAAVPGIVRGADGSPRPMTPEEASGAVDSLVRAGARVLLLYYGLQPAALRAAAARARALGVVSVGELGASTYYEAQDAGVDVFVHTSRYSLEVAAPDLRARVAAAPFGAARRAWYDYLVGLAPGDTAVARHARRLAAGRALLMPTLSLIYLMLPDHENPWREPAARVLDPRDIHLPADSVTGKPTPPPDPVRDGFPPGTAEAMLRLERAFREAGARYLAGSGTSAFGTMPGISLHTELTLLVRIGLTPREALAAATGNYNTLGPWRRLGRVAAGYDADLVLLDADPTADIRNAKGIRAVVANGRYFDRAALVTLLAKTEQ